jgi:hypothetical protein
MRLAIIALAVAALGVAAPAKAAVCPAEAALRADPRWRDRDCEMCMINRIYVGPRTDLRWNGARVTVETIRRYLAITHLMAPQPFTMLVIRPGADCAVLAAVRATIERGLPCAPGYYCSFALADARSLPPPPPASRRRRH